MKKVELHGITINLHCKINDKELSRLNTVIFQLEIEKSQYWRKLNNGKFFSFNFDVKLRLLKDGEKLHLMQHEKYNNFINQR